MMTIKFSRQNDAASRASTAKYWENLVLVVVLVLESKVSILFKRKLERLASLLSLFLDSRSAQKALFSLAFENTSVIAFKDYGRGFGHTPTTH